MPDVNQPMMVVRKRLSASEVSDPRFRLEDDVVQQTNDGTNWVDSPANDVRHADAWRLPPVVADDPRCQAAANMTRFIQEWLETLLPILSIAGSGWALLSTLILLFVVLGPFALVVIMLDVAATLLGIGATAIGNAFTAEVFDILTCIFYCNIDEDGQVSAEQLAEINSDVDDQIGGVGAAVLHLIFGLVGEVGVSNWGIQGDAPADCDECGCGWCYVVDLTAVDGGFAISGDASAGTWVFGTGWTPTDVTFFGTRTLLKGGFDFGETITIDSVDAIIDFHAVSSSGGEAVGIWTNDFENAIYSENLGVQVDGDDLHVGGVNMWGPMSSLSFWIMTAIGTWGGSATVKLVQVNGSGPVPEFFEANGWTPCEP